LNKNVLMIGPAVDAPGGMSAVVQGYQDVGLLSRWSVRYVATYIRPGVITQLWVMGKAVAYCLFMLVFRRVGLVHAHSASRGSFWRKALICGIARMCGVPYLFHIHSGEFAEFYEHECGALSRGIVRVVLRQAIGVLVLTPRWRAIVQKIEPKASLYVLPNPVRVPEHLPSHRLRARRVLFLGRLREKKGVFDLIKAIVLVNQELTNIEFVLAGDGDLEAVRAAARDNGVDGSIVLPGWVGGRDKERLLAISDVFVLPSYFEGLPVGILEAMALGVPVVATRVGGIPDMVTNREHAILVEPGDVRGLAQAVVALLRERDLADRLIKNAHARVKEHYSQDVVAEKLGSIYRNIMTTGVIEVRS
jgi:glycosyltransferase involved in cell wall biosynthesis